MSSEKSATELLAARDRRQEALSHALEKGFPSTVFLSLNIPGENKKPPGAQALFLWALAETLKCLPGASTLEDRSDALGRYVILGVEETLVEAKKRCVGLETRTPSARLVDLDVYAADGEQIGRESLGFPARSCLVCSQDAVECMRARRHPYAEVVAKANALLKGC